MSPEKSAGWGASSVGESGISSLVSATFSVSADDELGRQRSLAVRGAASRSENVTSSTGWQEEMWDGVVEIEYASG